MKTQENNLLDALIRGDSKGILEIYELVFPIVLNYITKNSGGREDAEDVFQRALIQLVTKVKVKKNLSIDNFEWYLARICKNLWLKELNSRKKRVINMQKMELINESTSEKIALEMLEQDRWAVYKKNFERLSDSCQQVLRMFLQKKPKSEIIEELGYSSEYVVNNRIYKCKNKLKSLIQADPLYKKLK